jgi:hypothetical protein
MTATGTTELLERVATGLGEPVLATGTWAEKNLLAVRLLIALALGSTTGISRSTFCQTLTIPPTLGTSASFSLLAAAITPIGFPLLPTASRPAARFTAVTTEWMTWSEGLLAPLEQTKTAAEPVTTALISCRS